MVGVCTPYRRARHGLGGHAGNAKSGARNTFYILFLREEDFQSSSDFIGIMVGFLRSYQRFSRNMELCVSFLEIL